MVFLENYFYGAGCLSLPKMTKVEQTKPGANAPGKKITRSSISAASSCRNTRPPETVHAKQQGLTQEAVLCPQNNGKSIDGSVFSNTQVDEEGRAGLGRDVPGIMHLGPVLAVYRTLAA